MVIFTSRVFVVDGNLWSGMVNFERRIAVQFAVFSLRVFG